MWTKSWRDYQWTFVLLAPIVSSLLAVLCFPPFKLWPLAWVCLIPLSWSVRLRGNAVSLYCGTIIGSILFHGIGLQFIEQFSAYENQLTTEFMFRLWLLLSLLHAWVWPLATFLVRLLCFRCHVPFVIAFATGWVSAEQARCCALLVLVGAECPIMHFGYCLSQQPNLLQLAALGGTTLISLSVAIVNATIVCLCHSTASNRHRWFAWLVAEVFVLVAFGLLQEIRFAQLSKTRSPIVGLVSQALAPLEINSIERKLSERFELLARSHKKVELLVWPEGSLPCLFLRGCQGADVKSQRILDQIVELGRKLDSEMIIGGARQAEDIEGSQIWNCVFHFTPENGLVALNDKRCLVPFLERVPTWADHGCIISYLAMPPRLRGRLVPSNTETRFAGLQKDRSSKIRMVSSICFDATSTTLFRNCASNIDLIVHVGNEPVDANLTAAKWMLDMAILRSVESGRPCVRCVHRGFSAIIDSYGRPVVCEPDPNHPHFLLIGEVPLSSGKVTLYSCAGDWPIYLFWILCWVHCSRPPISESTKS